MTVVGFVLLLVVGAICGAIAQMIVGFGRAGFLVSVAIGFAGAWIGTWLAPTLKLPTVFAVQIEGHRVEIFWTVLGAIALLLVVSLFRRSSYRRFA